MDSEKDAYEEYEREMNLYMKNLAKELGCSVGAAADVWYLRTRSRWTPELEKQLLEDHAAGKVVNLMDFGVTGSCG